MVYHLFVEVSNKSYKQNKLAFAIRIILIVILFPVVLYYVIKLRIIKCKKQRENAERVKIYNLSQLGSLSGVEFEEFLKLLFEQMGYSVECTKKSKDFGVDLILEKKNKKTIVQSKCYSHTVGISAVQEIISARNHYNINGAMVVTNQKFSKEAQILAEENDVMLAGGDMLEKLILKYPVYIEVKNKKYAATTKEAIFEIEQKYKYWI